MREESSILIFLIRLSMLDWSFSIFMCMRFGTLKRPHDESIQRGTLAEYYFTNFALSKFIIFQYSTEFMIFVLAPKGCAIASISRGAARALITNIV